ncbi:replication initiation and membrane attachment protein [Paenibacillus phyllosphaerae]|uniref:Replication initiation and membrane attachment protein n=1 Tax=Paenibacillus phyllosphaerae TaxID=274593 RepID=A0A7W5ATD7_9BACL|nr:replication initiation and membrane attachment protein [Paenibacillus phyllosphaerae]
MHQFTEHHRYYTFRDFAMSALDRKMLALIYQPMIGAFAIGLYELLYQQTAEDRIGYSPLSPQRKLFLGLGMDMNERGRQELIDQCSRLEAVGLLQCARLGLTDNDDFVYEYEMAKPLMPDEFFSNPHLTMLLRDKVGKYAVISLREAFYAKEADELAGAQDLQRESLTMPFYELFRLNAYAVDQELDQALAEVAPVRAVTPKPQMETAGIQYAEIITRFPRNSVNRKYVERLRGDEEQLAQLNYAAYKYNLSVVDLCRLLDEDDIFNSRGELMYDELQLRANQMYRQGRKRTEERERVIGRVAAADTAAAVDQGSEETPDEVGVLEEFYMDVPMALQGRCDIHQYNMLMRNEPHTRFIARFFPGAVPEWLIRVFEVIDLNYKLSGPVINVLIHYVLGVNDAQRVTKTYIDAVASNMLMKRVDTYEKAIGYVKEQMKLEQERGSRRESGYAGAGDSRKRTGGRATGQSAARGSRRKMDVVQEMPKGPEMSPEELAELYRLAQSFDGK